MQGYVEFVTQFVDFFTFIYWICVAFVGLCYYKVNDLIFTVSRSEIRN